MTRVLFVNEPGSDFFWGGKNYAETMELSGLKVDYYESTDEGIFEEIEPGNYDVAVIEPWYVGALPPAGTQRISPNVNLMRKLKSKGVKVIGLSILDADKLTEIYGFDQKEDCDVFLQKHNPDLPSDLIVQGLCAESRLPSLFPKGITPMGTCPSQLAEIVRKLAGQI